MASLDKYTGPWTSYQASHLLRRSTFGANVAQINEFSKMDISECVDRLLENIPLPVQPVNYGFDLDPNVPIGETWVDKGVTQGVNGYRYRSLRSWSLQLMINTQPNIREKMTLFWHNHFVVADINDPRFMFKNINLLRASALGNFKQLTKNVTIDPAMLFYLNGDQNTRQAPNENFARELLELFTLGKGELAGDGDYTTFTEGDVMSLAKALTGWMVVRNSLPIRSAFSAPRHDTGQKRLSHRFNNIVINNNGANEYEDVVDIIFNREEVSVFICRKLYRWFVFHKIDEKTESEIILPLAQLLRDSNYEIKPVLKALLLSEHFYNDENIGCIIKNPIEFMMGLINQFSISLSNDPILNERAFTGIFQSTFVMQMALFQAPSVSGWQAYYQAPTYYRLWINAVSLPFRKGVSDAVGSVGVPYGAYRLWIDPLVSTAQFQNPENPDNIVASFTQLLFPKPLSGNQHIVLKQVLLGTLTENGWKDLYNNYAIDPTNMVRRNAVTARLRILIVYMMRMPEYHLN